MTAAVDHGRDPRSNADRIAKSGWPPGPGSQLVERPVAKDEIGGASEMAPVPRRRHIRLTRCIRVLTTLPSPRVERSVRDRGVLRGLHILSPLRRLTFGQQESRKVWPIGTACGPMLRRDPRTDRSAFRMGCGMRDYRVLRRNV